MWSLRNKLSNSFGIILIRNGLNTSKCLTKTFKSNSYDIEEISDKQLVTKTNFPKHEALDLVNETNIELINSIRPSLKKSFNLAAYVNISDTLQQLVKLNVDISKLDKYNELASYIVRSDFKTDIEPYILFLLEKGIDISDIGHVINRNPFLLQESIDDLQTRINYFLFRKFSSSDISSILLRASNIFSLDTKTIDVRLGFLVNEYKLSPVELRKVINLYPRIIELNEMQIKKCTFMFIEEMGFNSQEIKSIIMSSPILWRKFYKYTGHKDFVRVFDFLHQEMGISHEIIANSPLIFNRRLKLIRERHFYLKTLNRAQYDPTKPLYIPLPAFYQMDDSLFCLKYAKTSVNDFNLFLKTL